MIVHQHQSKELLHAHKIPAENQNRLDELLLEYIQHAFGFVDIQVE
jgi:hypothetical protein